MLSVSLSLALSLLNTLLLSLSMSLSLSLFLSLSLSLFSSCLCLVVWLSDLTLSLSSLSLFCDKRSQNMADLELADALKVLSRCLSSAFFFLVLSFSCLV